MLRITQCTLCDALCGLEVEISDHRVGRIQGDAANPLSRGYLCPKAVGIGELHHDPDRLRSPMRRRGDQWEPIGWPEAFRIAREGLTRLREAHGPDALGLYAGNPNVHNLGAILALPLLFSGLDTRNRYSASSADQLPHMLAAHGMFGHQFLMPVPDLERTRLLIIVGANPAVSNGSIMTAPGIPRRLREITERGGRVIVLDPRRTETARLADTHHFVRPGSDALLFLGMLETIFAEELESKAAWRGYTDGLPQLRDLVQPFPAERVADTVGLPADTIRTLARQLASTPQAALYGRIGICTQRFGGLAAWLLYALNLVTGHLDRPGGLMFSAPAVDFLGITRMVGLQGSHDRWRSRGSALPEFGGELPVSALADEMETPGPRQIRALITVAGNPARSVPNSSRLERALGELDFMVSIDPYLNETTRHAHLILPPTSRAEQDHYGIATQAFAVRNTAHFTSALLRPDHDALHDWQILATLARDLGQHRGDLSGHLGAWAARGLLAFGPRTVLDLALRLGPYGWAFPPLARGLKGRRRPGGLKLADLQYAPHGLDLGPLTPCLPDRLFTANRRVQLAPGAITADLPRLEAHLREEIRCADTRAAEAHGPLLLIGRRHLSSNNSWMHNLASLNKGRDRCTLLVHPADAGARNIEDGALVDIQSKVGRLTVHAQVSDEVMAGVVSLPHGWGHAAPGTRLEVANAHAGVNANTLTDEAAADPLSGNAALSGEAVTVRAHPSPA